MCNDPAVTIAMAADSACLLGCRRMLFQWGIKSLILLLISMDGSRMDPAECLPPQLGSHCSHRRAGNAAGGGEASLGRHVGCEGLRSAEILPKTPSCSLGVHPQKLWEQLEQLLEGEAECPGSHTPLHHSSQGSFFKGISGCVHFYRCATATPV